MPIDCANNMSNGETMQSWLDWLKGNAWAIGIPGAAVALVAIVSQMVRGPQNIIIRLRNRPRLSYLIDYGEIERSYGERKPTPVYHSLPREHPNMMLLPVVGICVYTTLALLRSRFAR